MKKKIIHIHRDPKFLYEIFKYSSKYFENKLIYLGSDENIKDKYNEYLIPLTNNENIDSIIEICNNADAIVINGKNEHMDGIILKLPKDTIILWRFFGYELYNREIKRVLSRESQKFLHKTFNQKIVLFKQFILTLSHFIRTPSYKRVLGKTNAFLGIMDMEYDFLTKIGYKLPKFIQVPYEISLQNQLNVNKSSLIIFGNSRNIFNNHIDILLLLKTINLPKNLRIKMFFSYGLTNEYSKRVESIAKEIPEIELQKEFLNLEEFESIYNNAAALIINSYRQMAMANIYKALLFGVKVYLSEKNVAYKWFKSKNILIYSIEKDLLNDITNENYYLTVEEMKLNRHNLSRFFNEQTFINFNEEILKIISG